MSIKKLSVSEEKEIYKKYNDGVKLINLQKEHKCCNSVIYNALYKNGLIKKNNKLSELKEKEICEKYENGIATTKLQKEYGVASGTVLTILYKNKINIRNASHAKQIYSINENYFDKIDNEDKAYFLGLLFADGNNMYPRINSIRISLEDKDSDILYKFKDYIKSNAPVKHTKKHVRKRIRDGVEKIINIKSATIINITNIHMAKKLSELGMVQNKTLILKFPKYDKVPKYLVRHFIRGFFDGDGGNCLTAKFKKSILGTSGIRCYFASGSKIFLKSIISEINKSIGDTRIYFQTKKFKNFRDSYGISLFGYDSIKFMDWIYNGSKIYLNRKYENFKIMKDEYAKRKKIANKILKEKGTNKEIAKKYGFHHTTVAKIKNGICWKELQND